MPSLFPESSYSPALPAFNSLLVSGHYHPSAPIHLCLSTIAENLGLKAILISSSCQNLAISLQQYNDEWLNANSGLGKVSSLSSRVQLFYPPSPGHLCFLLSMFTIPPNPAADMLNSQTTLASAPCLIILHEPSAYFLSNNATSTQWTVSSYLSLIAHASSCCSSLTDGSSSQSQKVSLAVFDSQIEDLRLPMVKTPTPHPINDTHSRSPRLEHVYVFAQRYFEWRIVSSEDHSDVVQRKRTMAMYQANMGQEPLTIWTWTESTSDDAASYPGATRLSWDPT